MAKKNPVDQLLRTMRDKDLDPATVERVIKQVRHPKMRKEETDLSEHLDNGHIRFGIVSDTHLNNKFARTHDILPTLYAKFEEMGGSFVLHCGDLTDGPLYGKKPVDEMMYINYGDIVQHVIDDYPIQGDLVTYFIGGNEDGKFLDKGPKDQRADICEEVSFMRNDMIYLGMTEADVKLGKNTRLKMLHPAPGMGARKPYAISYPSQKIGDILPGGEKPDILCLGFYHRVYNFEWRGIETLFMGTTQNQTPDMRAHLLGADVASWFFDVEVDKKGNMASIKKTLLPFYK